MAPGSPLTTRTETASPVREFTDNYTYVKGAHAFKGGWNFRLTLQTGYNDAGIYPNVTFSATANGNAPAASVRPPALLRGASPVIMGLRPPRPYAALGAVLVRVRRDVGTLPSQRPRPCRLSCAA